jgi:tetratricopeptide (TPR) repeat protein
MRNLVPLAFAALFAISGTAFAAGGGGSSTTTSPATFKCKKGEVVKEVVKNGTKTKICVKATSGVLPDEELYQQGRLLAKQGQYDWALQVLAVVQNQNDPRVLNYQGYSNRKAGRLELGLSYYKKALAINPNFVLAREYLGEGYVVAGRPDLAKAQLAEIEKRCGTTCEEYKDLSEAIKAAQ